MLRELTEKEQVNALLKGDEAAMKEFFDEYFPRLYRFSIERVSGEEEAAKEVVQYALTKILLNIHKFRGDALLFTWMCAICKNEAHDYLRKQTSYEKNILLRGDTSNLEASFAPCLESTAVQPDDIYGRSEDTILIQRTLDQLPMIYSNVIEWKYIEELSVQQIAARLKIGHLAAQSMLFRARRAFQSVHADLIRAEA